MFKSAGSDASPIQLGGDYMESFNAASTTAPRDPTAADVPPLDPTADPVDD